MKNFRLPSKLGIDFKDPSIIQVKEIVNLDYLNNERTFSDCCCEGHHCHHSAPSCICQCVFDCGCTNIQCRDK
jgi:hypothetical protein